MVPSGWADRPCCLAPVGIRVGVEVSAMFTIRTLGGVALFLFGTTFIWLTPEFASRGISTAGVLWEVTRWLALVVVIGFTAATWGLFTRTSWWGGAAVASAALGLVVLIPYWIAAHSAGETTPGFNVLIHALGSAVVFALLLTPSMERWVSTHVMSG